MHLRAAKFARTLPASRIGAARQAQKLLMLSWRSRAPRSAQLLARATIGSWGIACGRMARTLMRGWCATAMRSTGRDTPAVGMPPNRQKPKRPMLVCGLARLIRLASCVARGAIDERQGGPPKQASKTFPDVYPNQILLMRPRSNTMLTRCGR